MKNFFIKVKKVLKNFFFANFNDLNWTCEVCGREIFEDKYFCDECYKSLPFLTDKICDHCGRRTPYAVNYCLSCKNKQTAMTVARSVFDYEMPVTLMIHRLKYRERRYLAKIFAVYMADVYFKNYFNSDVIVYIPMFKKDERKRGYNQAKLIAEELSEIINVKIAEDTLVKVKKTKHQVGLNREERLKNLKDSLKIKSAKEIKGKSVLIVDDVMTTGATVETAAELLKRRGAKEIKVLTVASVQISDDKNLTERGKDGFNKIHFRQ